MSLGGFVQFYIWNRRMGCRKNCCRFPYPQLLKNRFLQPVFLLRIVTQLVEMLACLLPCSGVTDKWPLSRSFYAGPAKWRENNSANMTSRARKKFPMRVSETKQVKITLACFKSLTAANLSPKDEFDQLFNFQGPVISECTYNKYSRSKVYCETLQVMKLIAYETPKSSIY